MSKLATFALGCAVLAGVAGTASAGEFVSGDWRLEARESSLDGRICSAATRALAAETMLGLEAAEGTISLVLSDPRWSLGSGDPTDGYRVEDSTGASYPIEVAYVYGDMVVADAPEPLVRQLEAARSALIHGPEGAIGEFSLRGSFEAIRALRACADL